MSPRFVIRFCTSLCSLHPAWFFQIGEIISRFEKKGFYLKALKLVNVERSFAEKHYADLASKPFFQGLVDYIISGPVVAMVWEGKSVVTTGRKIIGATNPLASEPGTIRGDFAVDIGRNVIHGSDSIESANKEIALWFPEGPADWQSSQHPWIYEK
uniref:Nucleoside diphosphate kinase n=1 Tax=Zea mays TaxID=4577 RepID=A0A804LNF3_MAIZE